MRAKKHKNTLEWYKYNPLEPLKIGLKGAKWSLKSGFFGGKKWVIGLGKLRAGTQSRKAKWCKMQIIPLNFG